MKCICYNKCSKCFKYHTINNFRKGNRILKNCIKCRYLRKKSTNKCKCIHQRQKLQCKECNDPIDLTIKTMVNCSRVSDKKNNRFEELNFVDYSFVKNLIDNSDNKCYYCCSDLQYKYFNNSLATIERINNNLGHIKSNVVIACRTCNLCKVGTKKK